MHTRIAHITDLHLDEELPLKIGVQTRKRLNKILKDIEKEKITKIICTGDIGENDGILYFFEQTKKISLSITLGNHDSFSEISKYLNKETQYNAPKLYSSIQQEYNKIIYLDSSEGIIDDQQFFWLKKELISKKAIIIFIHHPIIGLNLKVDEIGALKNRKPVLSLLENIPNEITVFCGHYHMESTIIYKNIKQNITPAVSFQIMKNLDKIEINKNTFGYRIIEIKKEKISSKVKLLNDAN